MKAVSCLLMGMDAQSQAIAEGAVQSVFPEAAMNTIDTLAHALKRAPAPGLEVLALLNPDPAILASAAGATDSAGLPRWAIVIFGRAPAGEIVDVVPAEEWNEERAAQVFRSALARHELLRENARLKGDLLTVACRVTHDLRTPLGAIVNTGETLGEILAEKDPAAAALADPIFDSTDDLSRLISRVGLVLKASASPVARQRLSMTEVIWAVLQRHERQISGRSAVVVHPESWPEVEGVASWLEAVWGNLLDNALQHGKEGGRVELGWSPQDGEFRFWISDNGPGVPAERLANLFQPFQLLHRTDARKGLGLSLVRRLVELQGGQCGYVPLVAGGSTFYFTLPVPALAAAGVAAAATQRISGQSMGEKHA